VICNARANPNTISTGLTGGFFAEKYKERARSQMKLSGWRLLV
jgi:hypothetical protein